MTDRQTDRQSYLQSQQHDNGTHIEVHSQQQVSNTVATLIHTANTHSSPASTDTPTRHTHTQLSSRITTADLMWPCPFQGEFVVHRLGLAIMNPYTKFKVYIFTHYEDMKGDAKCRNWGRLGVTGHPRSLAMSPFNRVHTTSYLTLTETMHLSYTIFELQQVIYQKLHLALPLGVTLIKFRGELWHQKARVPGLSFSIACVILC